MRVTPAIIENAVLQIFTDNQVEAGGRLLFTDLQSAWPSTRLRQGDLVQGIKHLVCDRHLELEDEGDGPALLLSESGYARATQVPVGPRGNWHDFLSGVWLNVARRRKPAEHSKNRRVSDRPAAA